MPQKIYIANDHGAVELKNVLLEMLNDGDYEVINLGTNSSDSVDYPEYADALCEKILEDKNSLGILMCGTGIGIGIRANRHKGIRAALCYNEFMASVTRAHNDANVLVMGGRVIGPELAKSITKAFLKGKFEGGRHQRRVDLLDQ